MDRTVAASGVLIVILAVAIAVSYGLITIPGLPTQGFNGQAAVSLTIHYADGTSKTHNPTNLWTQLFGGPKTIVDETGKEVVSVNWAVQVKAVWTGQVTAVSYEGSSVLVAIDMMTRQQFGESKYTGTPVNNQWTTVASDTLTAGQLENWTTEGQHQLNIAPLVMVKLTFDDGSTATKSADMASRWVFIKESGQFLGLSVTVETVPMSVVK